MRRKKKKIKLIKGKYQVMIINPKTGSVVTCSYISAVRHSEDEGILKLYDDLGKKVAWIAPNCWSIIGIPAPVEIPKPAEVQCEFI
jgi:hypothetical protein